MRNRLEESDGRVRAVPTDERETIAVRPRLSQRRLPRRRPARASLRRARAARSRTSAAASLAERRRADPGRLLRRLDQARPDGVIGTNKKDATETVALLLEDARGRARCRAPDGDAAAVEALLAERGVEAVLYAGWTSIDELERAAGEKLGRPRVKLRTWDELLAAARGWRRVADGVASSRR